MKTLTLNYYQDPGHGWVKIKRLKLKQLHIEQLISSYSYQRGKDVFLEEDNDLHMLDKACYMLGIKLQLREYHTNKQSKIRNYDSYKSDIIRSMNIG